MSVLRRSFSRALHLVLATLIATASVAADERKGASAPAPGPEVDTALIVAIDVSQSVDEERYHLQMEGVAEALEDPDVISAIVNGPNGGILFTMVGWSDETLTLLDWRRIGSKEDALATVKDVRALPHTGGEFTCMARMMRSVALRIVPSIPVKAQRVVLDVSGDGIDNCSDPDTLREEHDRFLSLPATINGLPILVPGENDIVGSGAYRAPGFGLRELSRQPDQDVTTLDAWYHDHVIGGSGAFLMAAHGYNDFGRALRHKFVTEISSVTADVMAR